MGNAQIKKGSKQLTTWKDLNASKHKHNYINKKILVFELKNHITYYEVLQCDKCLSFIGYLEKNQIKMYDTLTEEQIKLPKIYVKAHNYNNVFNNSNIIEIKFEK